MSWTFKGQNNCGGAGAALNAREVGGIEPHIHIVAQGLTPYCDQIVTVLFTLVSGSSNSVCTAMYEDGLELNTSTCFLASDTCP